MRVGQVTVVAPDREQSGTSHSLTLHRPLRPHRRHDGAFQVDGTPTDCVLLAVGALMPERPRFVFSGVNHGPNMGEDVLYSGTVSVAMEAVALGIPGIAFSASTRDETILKSYQEIVATLIRHGADVNLADREGRTALDHARQRGYARIRQLLQAAGAK